MKIDSGSFADQLRMLKNINPIERPSQSSPISGDVSGAEKTSFSEVFMKQYEESNKLGLEAEQAMQKSILGQSQNPHDTVIAIQKASVSLSLMMGIKERLERAYQEIIRTPV